MSSLIEIADRMLGDNFHIEDSMGVCTTEYKATDIVPLADTEDVFEALEQFEEIFYEVYKIKYPDLYDDIELQLLYGSDGTIHIGIVK